MDDTVEKAPSPALRRGGVDTPAAGSRGAPLEGQAI